MICLHLVPPNNLRVCSKCGSRLRGAELSEARTRRAVAFLDEERHRRAMEYAEQKMADQVRGARRTGGARRRMSTILLAGLALSMGGFGCVSDE